MPSVTGLGWGVGQLGVQEAQLQGLRGALRQLQQETEQNCRRELQQVLGQLAGKAWGPGAQGKATGSGLFLTATHPHQDSGHAWPACVRAAGTSEAWSAPLPRAVKAH